MSQTVLVIGAGTYQISGIKALKKRGLNVVAVDGNVDCPGREFTDHFFQIDIKDPQLILKTLAEQKIDINSCLCFATELGLRTVAYINNELNLPGLNIRQVEIATNKFLQRTLLKEAGLPCPKNFLMKPSDNITALLEKSSISFPLIVKPVDNSGSRGVFFVKTMPELKRKIEQSFRNSPFDHEIVIEEFIPGIELTCESLINHGCFSLLAVSQKKKPLGNFTVSTELFYNSPLAKKLQLEISTVLKNFFHKCNFDNTIMHTELIYSSRDNKIYLIETTVRSGGFGIFDKVLPTITGEDIVGLTVDTQILRQIPALKNKYRACVMRFFSGNQGIVQNINVDQEILEGLTEIEYGFFVKKGDKTTDLKDDGSRLGYIYSYADSWEEAFRKANLVEYAITIEIVPA